MRLFQSIGLLGVMGTLNACEPDEVVQPMKGAIIIKTVQQVEEHCAKALAGTVNFSNAKTVTCGGVDLSDSALVVEQTTCEENPAALVAKYKGPGESSIELTSANCYVGDVKILKI